ncbi:hypothetical protein, partial [Bradyrhizobium sp. 166]|uniref:hypothetical protein n=1 Tax=Bradyrhizobium sp. 166 TaxID=2782638 RepID=UPI001FF8A37D
CVHGAIDKADDVVFRCTLDGSQADRWLEVPAWMFDRTACHDAGFLTALSRLLGSMHLRRFLRFSM